MATKPRHQLTRAERRSLIALAVLVGVVFGVGMGIVAPAFLDAMSPGSAIALGIMAGVLFGIGTAWFIAQVWRRAGGPSVTRALGRALRTLTLPDDIDPKVWAVLLDRQYKEAQRARLHVVLLLVVAVIYLILGLTSALPQLGLLPWFGAALCAVGAVVVPIEAKYQLDRIRSLRSQLPPTEISGSGASD